MALHNAAPALLCAVLAALPVAAQTQRQQPALSGVLDTTARFVISEDGVAVQCEEYANLRLQTKIRDAATFNAAFNLTAASGVPAAGDGSAEYPLGQEHYTARMELERLSLRINGEYADAEMGLMRLAFGYGQIFGPSDFLNPRNPLIPNARPRGVLGLAVSAYPTDDAKVQVFASAPKNPLTVYGSGWNAGLACDNHWSRVSLQALYVFETPDSARAAPSGVHRAGLSVKADVAAGLIADALYTYNPNDPRGLEGLSASGGIDYSFLDGTLYLLAEYLFSGSSSTTAFHPVENPFGYGGMHNAYALVQYAFSDYTSASAACMLGFEDDDASVTPILTVTHDVFQGFSLTLTVQAPIQQEQCAVSLLARLKW
jgi:hypothetical protein